MPRFCAPFALLGFLALTLPAAHSKADASPLSSIAALAEACEGARRASHPRLYELEVGPGWRFEAVDVEEPSALIVNTRRNLRALDGHVSLLLTGLEELAFTGDDIHAADLRGRNNTRLAIGFFLGFDDPRRPACVLRGAHGVSTVRVDLAYAQLSNMDGDALARSETDRLRSWLDDQPGLLIEGSGPRGVVRQARFEGGQDAPESWQRALTHERLSRTIARCHSEGLARGAEAEGQVILRLNVETRTGRIRRADVALSSLGDSEEATCLSHALGSGARLPAAPRGWSAEVVDLMVPIHLTR